MAWQTPKTDWSAADGVRDSDFNRIEGNILTLYNSANMSTKTVYVSTTGNDVNGLGTAASPYATIEKALSVIPKNLNGQTVTISIASGGYPEVVSIHNYFGGIIKLINTSGTDAINVAGIDVMNAQVDCELYKLETSAAGLSVRYNAVYIHDNDIDLYGAGLTATYGAKVIISGTLRSFYTTNAVRVQNGSHAYIERLEGTSDNGIYASTGGILAYNYNTMTGGARTASGGAILNNINSNLADASVM